MTRIDLRSDTVTRPSPAMRAAMAAAEVGDAEYDDDPTVLRLQERCAEITGKQAALYLVTGTMCNQTALHLFVGSGRFVACARDSHVCGVELATSALLSSIAFREVPTDDGTVEAEPLREALAPDPDRGPVVDLVSVENTHQVGGGTPWSLAQLQAVREVASQAGVPVHMDGSRVFNASAATGVSVADYAAQADTVMFCLSKGLGAPIGSVLCGDADAIEEARRTKFLFGISWRQAGITAAAGLVALDETPPLLPDDHENARKLAEAIEETTPGAIDLERVRTNIVFADPQVLGLTADQTAERLADASVLVNVVGGRVRFVTHRDVSVVDVDAAAGAWRMIAFG